MLDWGVGMVTAVITQTYMSFFLNKILLTEWFYRDIFVIASGSVGCRHKFSAEQVPELHGICSFLSFSSLLNYPTISLPVASTVHFLRFSTI